MAFTKTLDKIAGNTFDYVIIGGGTAGLVLASRLTEDPDVAVCVLEAGPDHGDDKRLSAPGHYGFNVAKPQYDYAFTTVPQNHSDGNVALWPRGKGLGGSSWLNFYTWNRPSVEDINAIEELGNSGWNWDRFLKYSNKSETFIPPSSEVATADSLTRNPKYHGFDGPIETGFVTGRSGWELLFQDTLKGMGVPTGEDANSGQASGTFSVLCSINPRTNLRSDATAYLKKAEGRANLTILTEAIVSRILTSDKEKGNGNVVATGVEFLHGGKKHQVDVKREVLLCAGAIQSPQLLELSGIGDPAVLQKIGVPVKVPLPGVGANVQEHTAIALSYELKDPDRFQSLDALHDPATYKEQAQLLAEGKGSLMTLGALSYFMLPLSTISSRAVELIAAQEAKFNARNASLSPSLKRQYEIRMRDLKRGAATLECATAPLFASRPNPPEPGKKYASLFAMTNHPWSRGTIHAVSTNPTVPPAINPHLFEADFGAYLTTMLELVKYIRTVPQHEPLNSCFGREVNPGPDVQSDDDLEAWVKKYSGTASHTAGSCSMLPRELDGVVDPKLKVYGTENIRVVDLSVLPIQIASHAQTFVYALAEQAADIIKGNI